VEELKRLEPFGAGNPRPVFMTRELRVVAEPRIIKERHLKLRVAGTDGRTHEAIWWGGVEETRERTVHVHDRIEMAYTLEPNTWQGVTRLQLCVQDVRKQ
jgi:single-stranded-DNA-specific exonuclease